MTTSLHLFKSRLTILFHDIIMIPLAWGLAYLLRFNLSLEGIRPDQLRNAFFVLPILILFQVFFYWRFKLYRGIWRFASLPDLVRIIKAALVGAFVTALFLFFITRLDGIPRSIFPLYVILLVALLGGNRMVYRLFKDRVRYSLDEEAKRVLIIGAGQAGEGLARDMLRNYRIYFPVGFVDDDQAKMFKTIQGIRVIGSTDQVKNITDEQQIDLIMIALPSANNAEMMRIVDLCREAKVPFQTLPGLRDFTNGRVAISSLRNVALEDLLGREEINIDLNAIAKEIENRVVFVSGGGGSIGSELCRQIARFNPSELVIVDKTELNLHLLMEEMREQFPALQIKGYLADVTDRCMIEKIVQAHRPWVVFHAAAYKHVPLLEDQAYAAVKNNLLGTKVVAEEAIRANVDKFILISSDKAVNPTNVMGATKRAAELLCQQYNNSQATKFIIVRFGNVLGSSGSVVPLFKKQIEKGGPITVTHPDITRFFMTIPEAVRLILQSTTLGEGGELFVLDMGKLIKIQHLAEQMITLSGKILDQDIKIIHTGLRPGEKLFEELFYADEENVKTSHKKIFLAKGFQSVEGDPLEKIFEALNSFDHEAIQTHLNSFIKL
jgi:FlaA1/EpsC-like NDP-sugar epimerase